MSLFNYLEQVVKPAQKIAQGAGREITQQIGQALAEETQRRIDDAVAIALRPLTRDAAPTSSSPPATAAATGALLFSGILAPKP